MKVLVCDDNAGLGREIADAVAEGTAGEVEVSVLVEGALTEELTKLFERVRACLDNPGAFASARDLAFDAADLAILDNNLTHLGIKGARLTAEAIAGYLRAFTAVPYLVSLNKNPEIDFDLRYLVGDYETRADIALNTDHLSNGALWTRNRADAEDGFLPWYWPELRAAPARRRQQIAFVRDHLKEPVLPALGIPTDQDSLGFLSRHAKGALSPDAETDGADDGGDGIPIGSVTFQDVFVARSRSLPTAEEREKVGAGADAGNGALVDLVARVVAADIDLWFRRDVVAPQEMLIDVPHLLMRMPFLLGAKARDLAEWNKAIDEGNPPFGIDPTLFQSHIAKARHQHDIWVPSTAFRWPDLKANDELNALFFSSKQEDWADVVFCEDLSAFLERSPKAGPSPVEFSAEFAGSWARRHVAKLEDVHYAPLSQFAV